MFAAGTNSTKLRSGCDKPRAPASRSLGTGTQRRRKPLRKRPLNLHFLAVADTGGFVHYNDEADAERLLAAVADLAYGARAVSRTLARSSN